MQGVHTRAAPNAGHAAPKWGHRQGVCASCPPPPLPPDFALAPAAVLHLRCSRAWQACAGLRDCCWPGDPVSASCGRQAPPRCAVLLCAHPSACPRQQLFRLAKSAITCQAHSLCHGLHFSICMPEGAPVIAETRQPVWLPVCRSFQAGGSQAAWAASPWSAHPAARQGAVTRLRGA